LQSHDSSSFDFSLDLLPEEIFGTEEVPEYILSDSSAEEEEATPEQRTNHQLRRRIRHQNMTCGTSPPATVPNANVA
jgi:hypothetical protein